MDKKRAITIIGSLFLIASVLSVSGAVFTFLWDGSVTANTPVLMEYSTDGSTWNNAEDYDMSFSTPLYQGQTQHDNHLWRCANLPSTFSVELTFNFDGATATTTGDMEGVDFNVYFDDGTTNTTVLVIVDGVDNTPMGQNIVTINGGDSGNITYELIGDDNLMEDTYTHDVSVSSDVTAP